MIRDYDNITPGERTGADFGLLVLRLVFGLYFVIAGIHKVSGGTGNFVKFSSDFLPSFMPTAIGKGYLYAVPWLEILVGLGIMLGLLTALSSLIATLMLISFTIAVTGIKSNPPGGPFSTNLVFIAVTFALMMIGPGRLSADAIRFEKLKRELDD